MNSQMLQHVPAAYSWWRVHYRSGSLGKSAVYFVTLLGDLAIRLDRSLARKAVPDGWTIEDALDIFGKVLEERGISFAYDRREPTGSGVRALLDLDLVEEGLLICDLQVILKLRKHNRDLARLVMTAIGTFPTMSITDLWWMEEHLHEERSEAEADLEQEAKKPDGHTEFSETQERINELGWALDAIKQNQDLSRWGERLAQAGNSRVGRIAARWMKCVRRDLAALKVDSETDRLWVEWVAAVLDLLPEQRRIMRGKKTRAILDNSVFNEEGLSYVQVMGFAICQPDLMGYYEQWIDDEFNNCGTSDTLYCNASEEPENVVLLLKIREHLHACRRLLMRFEEIRESWEKEHGRNN